MVKDHILVGTIRKRLWGDHRKLTKRQLMADLAALLRAYEQLKESKVTRNKRFSEWKALPNGGWVEIWEEDEVVPAVGLAPTKLQ